MFRHYAALALACVFAELCFWIQELAAKKELARPTFGAITGVKLRSMLVDYGSGDEEDNGLSVWLMLSRAVFLGSKLIVGSSCCGGLGRDCRRHREV